MTERNLVICDEEFQYANRLARNMEARDELAIKVFVCTKFEHVLSLMKEKRIHLLIIDEAFSHEKRREISASQTFVLCKDFVKDLGNEEGMIRKYQCSDEIIREIFESYMEKTKENIIRTMRKEAPRIVAVYSPIHRVGKSTFAIALGKEYAKTRKTLFISLEEFAGYEGSFEQGLNLGDLIYYLKQGNGNIGIRLQSAVRKMADLDFLLPIPVPMDLNEITTQEWKEFLNQIVENSFYECIILDVGEGVRNVFQVLELCDRIYMPVLKDEISQRKLKRYDDVLGCLKLETIRQNTYQFVMPENVEEYAKMRAKEET